MTMFRITYKSAGSMHFGMDSPPISGKTEDVEAERYESNGEWVDFYDAGGNQVLRLPARRIKRIERLPESESPKLTTS